MLERSHGEHGGSIDCADLSIEHCKGDSRIAMSITTQTVNYETIVQQQLEESAQLKRELFSMSSDIVGLAEDMYNSLKSGGHVFFCGNGGAAGDSQHLAAELVGMFLKDRRALAGIALTVNPSVVTAVSNDWSFEYVFARQVEALMSKNDLLICISAGGNSPNLISAIEAAKKIGARTAALLGKGGGKSATMVDRALVVPSKLTPRIQEAHITIGHIACALVEEWIIKEEA
jgi:D-sedoheptulose 7-phosphate isomerase